MSLHFGLGQVALIPPGENPTPVPVALLTDVKIDASYKEVAFRGNQQYPVDVALTEGDIKITAKNAHISGATLSALLAGSTVADGSVLGVMGELVTVGATPYQFTVTHGADYEEELGLLDLTANKWLTRVAATPATGQYSVNPETGQYTAAAADTGHNLSVNYSYKSTTIGKTVTLNNQIAGTTSVFALACYNAYTFVGGVTRYLGLRFPAVTCQKLSLAMAPTKYTEQDLSFAVRQDTSSSLIVKGYTQE